jgi:glycosyl transferase family 25
MAYYNQESNAWRIDKIPAFCINLERRLDRWKQFTGQAAIHDLPNLKRFIGVDGKGLDVRSDERIPLLTKRNILSKQRRSHEDLDTMGGVGCALSHIGVWEWMVANSAPICLIFEDDAAVPFDFVAQANHTIDQSLVLQDLKAWDILTFCHQVAGLKPVIEDPQLNDITAFMGLQCYVITLDCAKKFLKEAYMIHMQIDLWMCVYKSVYGLTILGPKNYNVKQRNSKTDIQYGTECRICDITNSQLIGKELISVEELRLVRGLEIGGICLMAYLTYRWLTSK